jgi:hypothetical protein
MYGASLIGSRSNSLFMTWICSACTHQTRNCHDGRDRFIAQRAHTTVVVQRCNYASSENLVSWVTAWKILGGSESFL